MVVLLIGVDAKTQHNHIEKRRIRQGNAAGAVVVACMEVQLVDAGAVIVALQNWRVAAAAFSALACR